MQGVSLSDLGNGPKPPWAGDAKRGVKPLGSALGVSSSCSDGLPGGGGGFPPGLPQRVMGLVGQEPEDLQMSVVQSQSFSNCRFLLDVERKEVTVQ